MSDSWETLFTCDKCGEPIIIRVMKSAGKIIAVGKCRKLHKKRLTLSLGTIDEWAPTLDAHFFKCVKCDAPIEFKMIPKGPWAKVQITCSEHGRNETRLIPISIYNAMTQAKKQDAVAPPPATPTTPTTPTTPAPPATPTTPSKAITTSPVPNCQYCGGVTKFISQYSRYYCYKCQRYVEDKKIVEKVRFKPEPDDLKTKLKKLAENSDKNIPYAICDFPTQLNSPNIDSSKIESILHEMILSGELAGTLDPAMGEITFKDKPILSASPGDTASTSKQLCGTCGSELEYIKAKEAYFCRQCFDYTEVTAPSVPAPFSEGAVEAVRDFDYVGGQVRFKTAIRNKTNLVVTNIGVELDIPVEFQLIRILPEASIDDIKRGLSKIEKLMPNSSQGIDYYLEPVACGMGVVAGIVKYQDAQGNYKSTPVKPREIAIKCPLIFSPEEANIAMIRNLMDNITKDYRRWALPTTPPDSFTLLHDTVNLYKVNHVQAFQISGDPYKVESWYYTRAKTTNHQIAIQIVVSEQENTLDLTIACEDMAELTGLLAKIAEDFKNNVNEKLQIVPKPAFGNLKELLCDCGAPLPKLPSISEEIICNSCQKPYSWEMLS